MAYFIGTPGSDVINGTSLPDTIYGLQGIDHLYGGAGNDRLFGGSDNDLLAGGAGDDWLDGGLDTDWAYYQHATSGVTVSLLSGRSTGGDGKDTLVGIENVDGSNFADYLYGNDLSNVISGYNGSDYIAGYGGIDHLYGGAGDDALYGHAGNDLLAGGAGNDRLYGGAGNDRLSGDTGVDIFLFGPNAGQDTVTQFEDNLDKVDLINSLSFSQLTLSAISGGVRATITAAPTQYIDLMGVSLGSITASDFI